MLSSTDDTTEEIAVMECKGAFNYHAGAGSDVEIRDERDLRRRKKGAMTKIIMIYFFRITHS